MSQKKNPLQLQKMICYILERRPDEFGLVTDSEGYVKLKDLIKALNEEEGFGYVRKSHIDEILFSIPNPAIETDDHRIRAKNREHLVIPFQTKNLPKLVYTCIRRKAHPVVMEKGIYPGAYDRVILAANREMAERIGKRIDPDPVLLIVQIQKSMENGVIFFQAGEQLFLADYIPVGCFSGPPLPKPKDDMKKTESIPLKDNPKTPGSYIVNLDQFSDRKKESAYDKKRREIEREKERKFRRWYKEKLRNN